MSSHLEDSTDWRIGTVRCAVNVFERYSLLESNRLSLSLTLLEAGEGLRLSAIISGGSEAIFIKLNTLGEQAFLKKSKK